MNKAPMVARRRVLAWLCLLAVLLAALAFPLAGPTDYYLTILRIGMYQAILAATYSLLTGISGQFSFAHVTVAGLGGYAAVIWANRMLEVPLIGTLWGSVLFGTMVGTLVGLGLGALLERLRGVYLALFTVAFAQITFLVIATEDQLTGGLSSMGTVLMPGNLTSYYYVVLGLLVGSLGVVYWLLRSSWGLLLPAMREDADAAGALGVNVRHLRIAVFGVASLLASFAASVYFHTNPRLAPDEVGLPLMSQVLAFTVIGGVESPLAAAVAAVTLFLFLEQARSIDLRGGAGAGLAALLLAGGMTLLLWQAVSWLSALRRAPGRIALGLGLVAILAAVGFAFAGGGTIAGLPTRWIWVALATAALAGSLLSARLVQGAYRLRANSAAALVAAALAGGGIWLALAGDVRITVGVWRYALFGTALILIIRFTPDGLLAPLFTLWWGRDAAAAPAPERRLAPTAALARSEPAAVDASVVDLRVQRLHKAFGGNVVLNGISFDLAGPQICGLIGPNGAGKTTLVNILSGNLSHTGGAMLLRGERVDGLPPWTLAGRGIGRSFQVTRAFKRMTVLENVLVGGMLHRAQDREALERDALAALEFLGIGHLAHDYARSLSGGQLKLLDFARLMILDPSVYLLDEPFAGVTPVLREHLCAFILRQKAAGRAFLIVEHDMDLVFDLCDRIIVLAEGGIVRDGDPQSLRRDPLVIKAYLGSASEAVAI